MVYKTPQDKGFLFLNKKRSSKSPDFTGIINLGGVEYPISAWTSNAKDNKKYLKISLRKTEQRPKTSVLGSKGKKIQIQHENINIKQEDESQSSFSKRMSLLSDRKKWIVKPLTKRKRVLSTQSTSEIGKKSEAPSYARYMDVDHTLGWEQGKILKRTDEEHMATYRKIE